MADSTTATTTKADTVETGAEPVTTESGTTQANAGPESGTAGTESGPAGTEPGTGTDTATGGTGKDATGTDTTGTGTDTSASTPSVTIDLRPPALSIKHELLRLGLIYSNDWQDGETWVAADRSRNLSASIPDKMNSTSVTFTDTVTGVARTLTISQLHDVKTILTVSDEDKQLLHEGE